MSRPHVFIDESQRGRTYYVAAAVVPPDNLGVARKERRGLLRPGMRRLHTSNEKDGLKRAILAALEVAGLDGWIYSCQAKPTVARPACIRAVVLDAVSVDAARSVIENLSGARADRQLIRQVLNATHQPEPLRYEHIDPHEDPLLRAADAIAWAFGAGGHWRARVDPLITARHFVVP